MDWILRCIKTYIVLLQTSDHAVGEEDTAGPGDASGGRL